MSTVELGRFTSLLLFLLLSVMSVFHSRMTALHCHGVWDGMDLGLCSENQAQNEARSIQRAGQTVSSLLLSAAGPAASYCAFKQVLQTHTHTHMCPPWVFCKNVWQHIWVYLQIYPHHNGVLVLPGWSGHFLLFSGSRISASKRLYFHQTKDKGR